MKDTKEKITEVCNEIKELLLEKNRKYGDSALNPIRILSKSDSVEQLKVRIDDKLNRLKNLQEDETEDTITDLIGYLILLKISITKQEMVFFESKSGITTKPISGMTEVSYWGGKL
jgi:hypothetical protein